MKNNKEMGSALPGGSLASPVKITPEKITPAKIIWKKTDAPSIKLHLESAVPFLSFEALDSLGMFMNAFSTRLGGVSTGDEMASMNLSFARGDDEESVRENFRRMAHSAGFAPEDIVMAAQTHTANVRIVTEEDRGNGITRPKPYTDVDGLITNVPGLVLCTSYADCVPLFFADPVKKVIALSHSGWKGTQKKIGKVTVEAMTKAFGSRPEDIYAAIGPSICQDCYEVSEDVIDAFRQAFARDIWEKIFYAKENGRYQLNLWEANREVFREAGITDAHISLPNLCTRCNSALLYSHRAAGENEGRLAAFLSIRS